MGSIVEVKPGVFRLELIVDTIQEQSILGALEKAKQEAVRLIYEKHADAIMSKLNLDGMANLIAVYAAKELTKRESRKEGEGKNG